MPDACVPLKKKKTKKQQQQQQQSQPLRSTFTWNSRQTTRSFKEGVFTTSVFYSRVFFFVLFSHTLSFFLFVVVVDNTRLSILLSSLSFFFFFFFVESCWILRCILKMTFYGDYR
jgi:hypothetical protein